MYIRKYRSYKGISRKIKEIRLREYGRRLKKNNDEIIEKIRIKENQGKGKPKNNYL